MNEALKRKITAVGEVPVILSTATKLEKEKFQSKEHKFYIVKVRDPLGTKSPRDEPVEPPIKISRGRRGSDCT
jgi:hypothetical protein